MLPQIKTFVMNHWALCGLFLLILLALITEEIRVARSRSNFLTSFSVTQLINHESAIILDVRDPLQFRAGHIVNAKNIPLADFDREIEKLPANRPLIIVDALGDKALTLIERLTAKGFQRVYALKGGMETWKVDGLPVKGER